ncbi:UNVERIFIED_CONTAM: U-box domain-containing protein 38 [Sesamum latifolium]|uniref:RING-type E3 ubiquitin transferase n=1 Tax=Sesamum latifolium TaxID=2727402 RepID=A0AAW2Y7B4_9LAMI
MGSGKQRWKISFQKSSSSLSPLKNQIQTQTHQPFSIPVEFLCPVSGLIMADPVIVSSGHTFERNCLHACVSLSFIPTLSDAPPDFSTVIPNLALKSTILNCSDEYVTPRNLAISPPPFSTPPLCYSSSSSCDIENPSSNFLQEDELIVKLKSSDICEQEEALVSLRQLTRTREQIRARLCTPRLLSALKSLISCRYSTLQVNSVAALVNLSLEKQNKVKIVRSGIVPPLVDVLRSGSAESQEHSAGALFSLSLDDENKTAIGVLGALPPLLQALRSDSERTRHDSALALFHLSLVQSNRVKMIKLGSIQILLGMVKSSHMPGRALLVLCNLAASVEGRAAMLDGGAVECLVGFLSQGNFESEATRESCLAAIYGLSYGGLRFKGLAKEAGAEEVLMRAEETGSHRAKEKVKRILEVVRHKDEEEEEIDWEEFLNSEDDCSAVEVVGELECNKCS